MSVITEVNLKPSLPKVIPAFDADVGCSINFTWTGNQITGSMIRFSDRDTKNIYSYNLESGRTYHNVNSESLEEPLINGKTYYAYLKIYAKNGNIEEQSIDSDSVLIYCYSTPEFKFSTINSGDIIGNSILQPTISYSQRQGEELDNYKIMLYDVSYNLIYESDIYNSTSYPDKINGLSNGTKYYIRAIGETTHKMSLDTGYIQIIVSYDMELQNTILSADNLYESGGIKVTTNLKLFDYDDNNVIFQNGKINLKNGYVDYNKGIDISSRFAIKFTLYSPTTNNEILRIASKDGDIIFTYMLTGTRGGNDEAYIKAVATQRGITYTSISPYFNILTDLDKLTIFYKRNNDMIYSLGVSINDVEVSG